MIANIMAKLRSRIKFATDIRVSILCDDLATLLDIVEAMASVSPVKGSYRLGHFCPHCHVDFWRGDEDHTPDCAYLRARELCGKDGAS